MDVMPLGANMRVYRTGLGLTQEEAARQAGLKLNTWVRTELGTTRPTLDTLLAVAAALGVGLDDLVGERPAGAA